MAGVRRIWKVEEVNRIFRKAAWSNAITFVQSASTNRVSSSFGIAVEGKSVEGF